MGQSARAMAIVLWYNSPVPIPDPYQTRCHANHCQVLIVSMATNRMALNRTIPVAKAMVTLPTVSKLMIRMARESRSSAIMSLPTIGSTTIRLATISSRMIGLPTISLQMIIELTVAELMNRSLRIPRSSARVGVGSSFPFTRECPGSKIFRDH